MAAEAEKVHAVVKGQVKHAAGLGCVHDKGDMVLFCKFREGFYGHNGTGHIRGGGTDYGTGIGSYKFSEAFKGGFGVGVGLCHGKAYPFGL